MTLEELKQSDWYKERPEVIQQAVNTLPPIHYYRVKETGKQCYIVSYEEPESGQVEDVTVTVQKTGKGGYMEKLGLGVLDTNQVFGYKLDDLEIWEEE